MCWPLEWCDSVRKIVLHLQQFTVTLKDNVNLTAPEVRHRRFDACCLLFCTFLRFFGDICTFFSPTFLELWVILNKKSLHYKTIRSEASGNAAGIRCSLPTAAVRDGGGERIWMGGATGWQQRREDCKSTSMSHSHISSSFFGLDGMHCTSRVAVFKSSWSPPICVSYYVKR